MTIIRYEAKTFREVIIMKTRKLLSVFTALTLAAAVFTGCSSKGGKTAGGKITVGVFDMPTLYLMQTFDDMGYYDKNGANIDFEYFPVYSDAISAFNTGNVDMICYAAAEAVAPVVKGIDCKIIGVMDTSNGLDGIAAVNSVESVADLKGKNIAVEIGTVDHLMLQRALKQNGLSEGDVNLINMGAGDAAAAMNGGSLDAVSTWEPQLSAAAEAGHIIYSTKEDPDLIADIFLINGKALDKQYNNAKAFLKTWYQCIDEYTADSSKFSEAAAKKGNLSAEEFSQLMDVTKLVTLDENKEKFTEGTDDMKYLNVLLRNVGDFLYEGELIESQLTDDMISDMIDSRIIDDITSGK